MIEHRLSRRIINEAHLAPYRPLIMIGRIPKPKRSAMGWLLFIGLIALNEARGAYVVLSLLQGWS